jgi:hypothetical protein
MGLVLFSFVSYYLYIYIFFFFFFFCNHCNHCNHVFSKIFSALRYGGNSPTPRPPFAYASENVVFCGYIGYMVTSQ